MNDMISSRKQLVVKSNTLIQEARYSLSVQQQRILLYMISRIDPKQDHFTPCEISITEFCALCGLEGKYYAQIKQAISSLASCKYWFTFDGIHKLKSWISSEVEPTVDERGGTVTLQLSESMRPYLLHLHEKFTQYELQWVLTFKHKYSIRLYEYVISRHYNKLKEYSFTVPVEQIKAIMGAETYKRFCDYHRKALAPAVQEIDSKTNIHLTYNLKHKGKAVTDIEFTVKALEALQMAERESNVQHELGIDPDQITLWDELKGRGLV